MEKTLMQGVKFLLFMITTNFAVSQDLILFHDPEPLPDIINSDADEVQPVFSKDSSQLYFVRAFHEDNAGGKESGDQDIWVAYQNEDGEWESVENVSKLNNKEHNGVFGISTDGSTIYLLNAYLRRRNVLEKGIAVAKKKNSGWERNPETLKIEGFSISGDHYSFHINEAEDIIVISDNGENSMGQEDLYVTKKEESGKWHKPIHLGADINSAGFEISPFLSPNADTLYFSTDGRPDGYGDADVYYSIREDESWQNWTTPKNLGNKVNSTGFDAYFIMSDKHCYFASNRSGNSDIYHGYVYIPPPPPIKFNVLSSTDPSVIDGDDGTITLHNLEPDFNYDKLVFYKGEDSTVINNALTDEDGQYTLKNLTEGEYDNFKVYFYKYVAFSDDQATLNDPEEEIVETPSEPVVKEKIETIVYFDLNSSYLRTKGKNDLKDLASKLKNYNKYKVSIEAHTDLRASDKYNIWLSKRRMNRVKDFLKERGITSEVIQGDYKGEKQPIHDCEECSEEKHQENRRATVTVELLE